MSSALTPVKVAAETDQLIAHAAHFLHTSKKEVVDRAIRDYVESHRDEINAGVRAALAQLDGTSTTAVSVMTGLSAERLNELGGVPED